MGVFRKFTIAQKLTGSFVLILLVLGLQSHLSTNSLSRMNSETTRIVSVNQPALVRALELKSQLHDTGRDLGFYLITHEEKDRSSYESSFARLWDLIDALRNEAAILENEALLDLMESIHAAIERTEQIEMDLAETSVDPVANMPAIKYATETFNPRYRERLQLLNSLIGYEQEEEGSDARRELYDTLVALRYYWTSLNNEQRLFLAFRVPAALENAKLYKQAIQDEFSRLQQHADLFTFEQEDGIADFEAGLEEYWSILDELFRIHMAEGWRQDAHILRTQVAPALADIDELISGLVSALQASSRSSAESASQLFQDERAANFTLVSVAFLFLGLLGLILTRNITQPIRKAVGFADQIAQGKLENEISAQRQDEIGELLVALAAMQEDLRARIEADALTAAENLRIRRALDNVATAVTLSDRGDKLIYINQAAARLLQEMQPKVQSGNPAFRADELLGSKLPGFINDPSVQAAYQSHLKEPVSHEICFSGRNLRLVESPVYDESGRCQGRVTQWQDVTEELRLAEEERRRIESERKIAAENARIRSALDNVTSNLMLADMDRNIIYMNKSAATLFRDSRDEIRRVLPAFDPEQLIGTNIDDFHAHPGHQEGLLANLKDTHQSDIRVGQMTMRIIANPVVDDQGNRLGTAVEWSDRTQEVAVEREIDALVEAARAGDLTRRIHVEGDGGFFRQLGEGFNQLLDQLGSVFDDIARVMSRVADGDLNHRIEREYSGTFGEVKDDINKTIGNLSGVLDRLRDAGDSVALASNEISRDNVHLSMRTEKQASSLEETAASMEQLTSTVRNNASNAQRANQLAVSARQSALKGGDVVSEAVSAMEEIRGSSSRIAEITGVIDEIAFQTNLLALNASVEAARAGEQGRGFAVVASEVRNLASRSADAAKEIKALIQDSMTKVEAGTDLVNASGETLDEIVDGIKKVGDIIAEIAAASAEQSAGIEQVNRAVTSMDEMTQQNSSLAEKTSSASAQMSEKAMEMQKLVSFFKATSNRVPPVGQLSAAAAAVTAPTVAKEVVRPASSLMSSPLQSTDPAQRPCCSGRQELSSEPRSPDTTLTQWSDDTVGEEWEEF